MAVSPDTLCVPVAQGQSAMLHGNALAILSVILWAASFPAAELLLENWDPLALIAMRLTVSVALLIPIWALIDGQQALLRANWTRGIWVGGLCFGLGMYLFLVAQKLTDPVTVALIASAAPVAAAILEFANRIRRPTMHFILGLGLAVLGGIIATSDMSMADVGLGAMLAVISAFFFLGQPGSGA